MPSFNASIIYRLAGIFILIVCKAQHYTLKKQMGYKYPFFSVVLPEFQTTHLSIRSYSNPSNFWVTMPNYFAVNLTSHTRLLQPAQLLQWLFYLSK